MDSESLHDLFVGRLFLYSLVVLYKISYGGGEGGTCYL